jgi:uncharacterized Zn-binding protein involved in type VI secretion
LFPASNHGPGQNIGFPDVCLTPGVPPIPVPYPNLGPNAMAVPVAPNVLVSGLPAQNMGSMPAMTNGDNAGCIHPLGMMKPGGTVTGNPMIIINGLPSKHLLCPSQGNTFNNPLGATLVPDVVNVLYCDLGDSALVDLYDLPDTSLGLTAIDTVEGLLVIHVRRDGLATRMGLRQGDELLRQDNHRLTCVADLRPVAPGALVTLRVSRKSWAAPRELRCAQSRKRMAAVSVSRHARHTARVTLRRVSHAAPQQLCAALMQLQRDGIDQVELDLRANPGGALAAAAEIAGAFLPAGSEVARLAVAGCEVSVRTQGQPIWDGDVRVLIDGQTASAAEVIAAALRTHDRAKLFGKTSFGKTAVHGVGLGHVGQLSTIPANGLRPDVVDSPLTSQLGTNQLGCATAGVAMERMS